MASGIKNPRETNLVVRFNQLQEELHYLIQVKGILSEETINKSQELDKIVAIMQPNIGGNYV